MNKKQLDAVFNAALSVSQACEVLAMAFVAGGLQENCSEEERPSPTTRVFDTAVQDAADRIWPNYCLFHLEVLQDLYDQGKDVGFSSGDQWPKAAQDTLESRRFYAANEKQADPEKWPSHRSTLGPAGAIGNTTKREAMQRAIERMHKGAAELVGVSAEVARRFHDEDPDRSPNFEHG